MKILVGLSGGVDSAVAAYLLQQEGHEVVAGFMLNYLDENNPNCTTKQDLESFHAVRKHLGIEAYEIFDYREEYEQRILNYIYEGYEQGITPNPDVYCNSLVKFDLFRKEAMAMGFDKIVTGHYARIAESGKLKAKGYMLLKGVDITKDQSYFLSQLDQEQLSQALFPLGGLLKSEVRKIAHRIGLPNADRPDSQGLCFVGKVSMRDFLMEKIGPKPGIIIDLDGMNVGEHAGAYLYTIGQRRNLYLPFQAYVVDVDVIANIVTVARVGQEDSLLTNSIIMHDPHWISGQAPQLGQYQCKIRYRQEGQGCELKMGGRWGEDGLNNREFLREGKIGDDNYIINFEQAIKGVANGQIVVIYDGDEVVGSGVIQKVY